MTLIIRSERMNMVKTAVTKVMIQSHNVGAGGEEGVSLDVTAPVVVRASNEGPVNR